MFSTVVDGGVKNVLSAASGVGKNTLPFLGNAFAVGSFAANDGPLDISTFAP